MSKWTAAAENDLLVNIVNHGELAFSSPRLPLGRVSNWPVVELAMRNQGHNFSKNSLRSRWSRFHTTRLLPAFATMQNRFAPGMSLAATVAFLAGLPIQPVAAAGATQAPAQAPAQVPNPAQAQISAVVTASVATGTEDSSGEEFDTDNDDEDSTMNETGTDTELGEKAVDIEDLDQVMAYYRSLDKDGRANEMTKLNDCCDALRSVQEEMDEDSEEDM
ncbi:hypothetical protein TruAng_000106 [Truncatella angustata]|nr:hypothetical protein TruAng_000106 [Truncatella angustata]